MILRPPPFFAFRLTFVSFCHFAPILRALMDDLVTRKKKTSHSQRILRGVYSKNGNYSEVVAYALRFPNAIFTLSSALAFYQMGDFVLEPPFDLVFLRGSRINHDPKIHQHFESSFERCVASTTIYYRGRWIWIYTRERLLVEIFHAKNKLGPERYQTAIQAFREIVRTSSFKYDLFEDICKILCFARSYPSRFALEVL